MVAFLTRNTNHKEGCLPNLPCLVSVPGCARLYQTLSSIIRRWNVVARTVVNDVPVYVKNIAIIRDFLSVKVNGWAVLSHLLVIVSDFNIVKVSSYAVLLCHLVAQCQCLCRTVYISCFVPFLHGAILQSNEQTAKLTIAHFTEYLYKQWSLPLLLLSSS